MITKKYNTAEEVPGAGDYNSKPKKIKINEKNIDEIIEKQVQGRINIKTLIFALGEKNNKSLKIKHETEKAILVEVRSGDLTNSAWLPKSQIKFSENHLEIPFWMIKKITQAWFDFLKEVEVD